MSKINNIMDHVYSNYYTFSNRPSLGNAKVRKQLFRSYKRIFGSFLRQHRNVCILDVGCGAGSLLMYLTELGFSNLHGFDRSSENVQICHSQGLHYVKQLDLLEIKADQFETYDIIFMLDVLEHLPKAEGIEIVRVLRTMVKSGGWLIIQTPNMGSILGLYHRYSDLTHEFGLSEKSAVSFMLAAGFELPEITISAVWNGTTLLGYLREIYLRIVHFLIFVAEGEYRPKIPTKNLVIKARHI